MRFFSSPSKTNEVWENAVQENPCGVKSPRYRKADEKKVYRTELEGLEEKGRGVRTGSFYS